MFILPYETRIGKSARTDKLIENLNKARMNQFEVTDLSMLDSVLEKEVPEDGPLIYFVNEKWRDVEFFTQVIAVPHEWMTGKFIYFVDVRQQTTVGRDGAIRFKSSNDRLFTLIRVLLTVQWHGGDTFPFFNVIDGASLVYTQWITRAVGKAFALTPASQMRVNVLAGIFFRCLFVPKDSDSIAESGTERARSVMATQISKATRAPMEIVLDMIQRVDGNINDVEALCKAISEHSESLTLESMSVAKLFNALSMTWFGTNAGEHAACAVEYPPSFYAMILTAMRDNSYRKTMIGEIVKDNQNKPELRNLSASFKRYLSL